MAKMVNRKCACCGIIFPARKADVKRGWGRFCTKSCKAKKQEAKTGQNAAYHERKDGLFSDAHRFSNEDH